MRRAKIHPKPGGHDHGGPVMGLFRRKNAAENVNRSFDPAAQQPAMRCSICTGEKVFGLRDRVTGTFEEVGLVRDGDDLARYCAQYGISPDDVIKFY